MDFLYTNKLNRMNTITINDKEYKIKSTIRAMFIFEQITKKSFKIETMLDNYIYFYSLILANNEDVLEWDDFIDALDNDPQIYMQLLTILDKSQKIDDLLNPKGEDNSGVEKKN